MVPSTGGRFTLPTEMVTTVSESLSAGEPSSVTVKVHVVVACIIQTPGVQLNTLVDGLKLAPVGTLLALKARPSPSGIARRHRERQESTLVYLFEPMVPSTGGRFTLPTEMVTTSESLSAGLHHRSL